MRCKNGSLVKTKGTHCHIVKKSHRITLACSSRPTDQRQAVSPSHTSYLYGIFRAVAIFVAFSSFFFEDAKYRQIKPSGLIHMIHNQEVKF